MNIQNIQSGLGMLQQMMGNGSVGRADKGGNNGIEQLLSSRVAEFRLQAHIFSSTEVQGQGREFDILAAREVDLRIAIAETGMTMPDSAAQSGSSLYSSMFDETGYWGANRTAARIADFVLNGAGDDINRLRAGREGILRGLKEAEEIWGGALPDISYDTMNRAVEQIDQRISELGAPVIDVTA